MTFPEKPQALPARAEFSSGPCPKRPGWSLTAVAEKAWLGRSHRASGPKAQLKQVIDLTATLLGVPEGYKVGIVPASDTGAFEMAMWSMLGARPVDMLAWESFGAGWAAQVPFLLPDSLKVALMIVIALAVHAAFPDLRRGRN